MWPRWESHVRRYGESPCEVKQDPVSDTESSGCAQDEQVHLPVYWLNCGVLWDRPFIYSGVFLWARVTRRHRGHEAKVRHLHLLAADAVPPRKTETCQPIYFPDVASIFPSTKPFPIGCWLVNNIKALGRVHATWANGTMETGACNEQIILEEWGTDWQEVVRAIHPLVGRSV